MMTDFEIVIQEAIQPIEITIESPSNIAGYSTPNELRNALELLTLDERVDYSAIKNTPDKLSQFSNDLNFLSLENLSSLFEVKSFSPTLCQPIICNYETQTGVAIKFNNFIYFYIEIVAINISNSNASPLLIKGMPNALGNLNATVFNCDSGLKSTNLTARINGGNDFSLYYSNADYRPVLCNEIGTYLDIFINGIALIS